MTIEPKHILLIEDNPGDARLLEELLAEEGFPSGDAGREFTVQTTDRISKALKLINELHYDVILLDLSLPDGSGKDTVRRICSFAQHIPIIVLTGLDDDGLALEAVQAGAQDYLVKGQANGQILMRAMRHAIERKATEERLQHQATHDTLTDLPNRALYHDRLQQTLERARRSHISKPDKWETAIMLLDLDAFKTINDTLGHPEGDLLLQAVADRLGKTVRKTDTVARMGGDEFTLIFENISGEQDVVTIAKKIQAIFSQPFEFGGHILGITASIGISLYPNDGKDAESLLKCADIAMYQAKRVRNCYCFYKDSQVEP